jgi:hypothetical protein
MSVKTLYNSFKNEQVSYDVFRRLLAVIDIDALNIFDESNLPGTTKCFDEQAFFSSYTKMVCERKLVCS